MNVLDIKGLGKNFGELEVIKNLSFSVPKNSVFGFIGKNGAGKTTTMKMILGFLKPTQGEIWVCGEKVVYGDTPTNRHIGYLPDVPEFYDYMSPREYLRLCGEISGLSKNKTEERSKELLGLVGLDGVNRKIRGYSRGMKQRLGIAQALLNEPQFLICDEPTSALDPVGRKEILDILSLAKTRTTILFSTHILSDVERISDRIGVLDEGKLVLEGTVSEIKEKGRKDIVQIELYQSGEMARLEDLMQKLPFVQAVNVLENRINLHLYQGENHGKEILEILSRENIPVLRYELLEPSLEHIFMEVTG